MSVVLSILFVCFSDSSIAIKPASDLARIYGNYHNNRWASYLSNVNKMWLKKYPSLKMLSDNWNDDEDDPRLFYQSEMFNKLNNILNANEMPQIYPENDVVLSNNEYYENQQTESSLPISKSLKKMSLTGEGICIKCPSDRTMVIHTGHNSIKFKPPHLKTCLGAAAPKSVQFVIMYGPSYGSFIEKGTYKAVGHITYKNKILDYCALNIKVLVKKCQVPNYLSSDCVVDNKTCSFTCRDPKTVLNGPRKLQCKDNKWSGNLPRCVAKKHCRYPTPPQHGHLTCKITKNATLQEGDKCRVKCANGWRPSLRSFSMCKNGTWTHNLTCIPKNS